MERIDVMRVDVEGAAPLVLAGEQNKQLKRVVVRYLMAEVNESRRLRMAAVRSASGATREPAIRASSTGATLCRACAGQQMRL